VITLPTLIFTQVFYSNITSSSSLAGSTAQHFLTVSLINCTIPSGAHLYLNYSSQWNIVSTARANSNDFCESNCTLSSVFIVVSANTIKINNFFPNNLTDAYITLGLSLANIINPQIAITDTASLEIFIGTVKIYAAYITLSVNPAIMTCTGTPASSVVADTTSYSFTVTPNPNVPLISSGSLKLNFPTIWSDSFSAPVLVYSSCSASCILSSATSVTATSLFTGTTTSPFTFTVDKIVNPGTTRSNNQLYMTYQLFNGSTTSSCAVTISGLTVPSLLNNSFAITGSTGILTFASVLPPLITDQILLTFPQQIYLGNVAGGLVKRSDGTQDILSVSLINSTNQLLL
jgi:hypothetical protein